VAIKYDEQGRMKERTVLRADLTLLQAQQLNDRGVIVRRARFLTKAQQLPTNSTAQIHEIMDDAGRLTEIAYRDKDGRPALHPRGYAGYKIARNEKGLVASHLYYGLGEEPIPTRVTVLRVAPSSSAARCGLQAGDALLTYDSQPVTQLISFIGRRRIEGPTDQPRPLVVLRRGKTLTLTVPPGPLGAELADVAFAQEKTRPR
jgi:S1-C subfamily serine protease